MNDLKIWNEKHEQRLTWHYEAPVFDRAMLNQYQFGIHLWCIPKELNMFGHSALGGPFGFILKSGPLPAYYTLMEKILMDTYPEV